MSESNNNRIEYIDLAKGLGMLAVIWGHIMHGDWSYQLVYAFDIPLFFFLSGMVFVPEKYESFTKFFKRRIKTLLIPYVIFSFVTWLFWIAYNIIFNSKPESWVGPLLQTFIAQGSTGYFEHNSPLWFVSCLFVVEMVYFFLSMLDDRWNIAICVGAAIIGKLLIIPNQYVDFTALPWNIESACSALIFYAIGNLFKRRMPEVARLNFVEKSKLKSVLSVLVLSGLLLAMALLNGDVSLGSNHLGNSLIIYYVAGLCGTASTLIFSRLLMLININKTMGLENKPFIIRQFVEYIGKNSFYFMAIHVPIKRVFTAIVASLFHETKLEVSSNIDTAFIMFVSPIVK